MNIKRLFIPLLFLSYFHVSFAQNKNAYGAEKGIYLLNTLHPANNINPFRGGVTYLIERTIEGKNEFSKIMNYSTPKSLAEFINRANKFQRKYPIYTELNQSVLLESWTAYEKTSNWDSLKKYLSYNYVAAGFGVLVLDTNAVKNLKYQYKISLTDASGSVIESIISNAVSFPENMTYKVPSFYKQTTDGISSTLIWKSLDKRVPHHFKVFRASSEKGDFMEYNLSKNISQRKDTIFYSFTDNNMNKGNMYRYYIVPSNNYGNYNIHSDTVLGTNLLAKDAALPTHLFAEAIDSANAIKLSWKLENNFEIDAIELFRGTDYDKPFEKIISLSPESVFYFDKAIAAGNRYFYKLKVIDRLGRNSIYTNTVFAIGNGTLQPLPPIRVLAKPNEKGVTLYWLPNGENIRGFYIYRCEGIEGEYAQISPFIPFKNTDTLLAYTDIDPNLTPGASYSYTVKQENNGHVLGEAGKSALITPVHLHSKIKLPMVYLGSDVMDKGALLMWKINESVNGVYGLNILRKTEDGKDNYVKVNKIKLELSCQNYTDTTIDKNVSYTYKLSFINKSGDETAVSNLVHVNQTGNALASPFNLEGQLDNNSVKLTWESTTNRATEFKIYRRIPGQKPVQVGSVKNSVYTFTESAIKSEEPVFYYVTAINKQTESMPSNEWKMVKE